MSRRIDLTGKRFGSLQVISEATPAKNGNLRWRCLCDCGGYAIAQGVNLRTGHTKSCGCFSKAAASERFSTHRESKTRLYKIYKKMKHRCLNSNNPRFDRYGGRGIAVCDEWLNDFGSFREWALSNDYSDDLSIDRINNNGNYEPSNCRWADSVTQNRNSSASKLADYSVALIKRYLSKNIMTHKEISKLFGVTESAISCIATGKTWRDIEPA